MDKPLLCLLFFIFPWFPSTNLIITGTIFIFDILEYPAFLLKCIKYDFALLIYFKLTFQECVDMYYASLEE